MPKDTIFSHTITKHEVTINEFKRAADAKKLYSILSQTVDWGQKPAVQPLLIPTPHLLLLSVH